MNSLDRASKTFGFAGTAMLHCGLLLACLVVIVPQAVPVSLPPPVEALRITLADPVAVHPPKLQAAPAPAVEETSPPKALPAAEKPLPAPKADRAHTPRTVQAKATPARNALPRRGSEASPAMPLPDQESRDRARKAEETRQTLLSVLVARLEREKRYPTAARRLGVEGQVTAMVRVDSQGRIISVNARAHEPQAMLEQATLEALQRVQDKWTPVPVPESMTFSIPVRYSLKKS